LLPRSIWNAPAHTELLPRTFHRKYSYYAYCKKSAVPSSGRVKFFFSEQ
jgi:hypothetical protein